MLAQICQTVEQSIAAPEWVQHRATEMRMSPTSRWFGFDAEIDDDRPQPPDLNTP